MIFKVALDAIGVTGLGVELEEPTAHSRDSFHAMFEAVLHGGPITHLMTMLNAYFPFRKVLPLEANRTFLRARKGLDSMLRGIVRQRIADMDKERSNPAAPERRDLLSSMLEESAKTEQPLWSEDELVNHVSRLGHWFHAEC